MVKKLIEAGADPAKADKSGNTPLHAAAGEGAMACVNLFVEKGVPSGVKNVDGFTPLVRNGMGLEGGRGGAQCLVFWTICTGGARRRARLDRIFACTQLV